MTDSTYYCLKNYVPGESHITIINPQVPKDVDHEFLT